MLRTWNNKSSLSFVGIDGKWAKWVKMTEQDRVRIMGGKENLKAIQVSREWLDAIK